MLPGLTFYSVQSADDAARLMAGGAPWPLDPTRAHLGPGLYAWGTRAEAQAYEALKLARGANVSVLEFAMPRQQYMGLTTMDLRKMDDVGQNAWLGQHSLIHNLNATPHGFQQVIRGSEMGDEYFFSSEIFNQMRPK
jgi:hypothetical protein